jgi:hypothetical protein
MIRIAAKRLRERLPLDRYETMRWLVMTAVALACFLGFQLADTFLGP